MQILDGKHVAQLGRSRLKTQVDEFKSQKARAPGLAVILVGQDPASQVYVRNKINACADVGIQSFPKYMSVEASEAEILQEIKSLNANPAVDGILVQLPLPKHLNSDRILAAVSPDKDPDCLTAHNVGRFFTGQGLVQPCTPKGVISILKHYKISLQGKSAVVVGRSHIVGRPMAELLLQQNCSVTIVHSKTPNISHFTKSADIVVVAAGQPQLLGAESFKQGSVVVDVGIHRQTQSDGATKLCGDVRADGIDKVVAALTPVPGGVGPMTIVSLLENTLALAQTHV